MKKLLIVAHPSSQGFSHKIAQKYQDISLQKGDEVEILDLYKTDLQLNFLSFESNKEIGHDEVTKKLQEKIAWADELSFIFPVWWSDCPAIMKNFIDSTFTSGFAFKYVNWKPSGLLKGKTSRIFATCGAPSFFYKFFPVSYRLLWWATRIGFCWMKLTNIQIFGGMDTKSDEAKTALLEEIN